MKKTIDIRIAKFFIRLANYYIKKRSRKIDDELLLNKKWLSNFTDNNSSFIYDLSENIKINLFKDSILCKSIFFSFEETELSFIKRYLNEQSIFFDVGANIGLFSLHASSVISKDGQIYAFEPTPVTFNRLYDNVKLNSLSNITLVNKGLSNADGVLKFNIAINGYDAWNSFAKLEELENSQTIDVNVITLDSYILEQKIEKIDLVKIDVEGWELNVLKGATSLLSSEKSPVLLVEFTETNAFSAGYYCGELFDYVKSFGYEWYSYNSTENTLKPQIKKLHYPYENLIAIKDIKAVNSRLHS